MIKFYRGLREFYNENHYDGIYFAQDTLEILHGGYSYSGMVDISKSVLDIQITDGYLIITYTDNTTAKKEISISKYKSNIADKSLTMPNSVGGISKDTSISDLEGKTYNELLDDLLFPTIYPTYIKPTASIKLSNYASIQEVGQLAPTQDNFITTYNAGQIVINGVKQSNRGGDLTDDIIYCNNITEELPDIVKEGNSKYVYRAYYAKGPQPKDNKGNDYGTPLESGYEEASVTINGTYPWYATTSKEGVLTKQNLVAWSNNMSSGEFTLLPHTKDVPQQFKLPKQATKLQMYNTVAKSFDEVRLSDWEESQDTTNGRTYYNYSYSGENRGSVTLIVNF